MRESSKGREKQIQCLERFEVVKSPEEEPTKYQINCGLSLIAGNTTSTGVPITSYQQTKLYVTL
jgi:hypothetical protein